MKTAAALALVAVACGARPSPVRCDRATPDNVEDCLGQLVDGLLTSCMPTLPDDEPAVYVSRVGRRVTRALGDARRRWTFRILATEEINAYALPGGTVYITQGLLEALRSEAELAAVLAHEVAHVALGHSELDAAPPSPPAPVALEQEEELQADRLAVELVHRAGYDPRALPSMLRVMHEAAGDDGDWTGRHPPRDVRLARVFRALAGRGGGVRRAERYRAVVASLPPMRPRATIEAGTLGVVEAGFQVAAPAGWRWADGGAYSVCRSVKAESPSADATIVILRVATARSRLLATLTVGQDWEARSRRIELGPVTVRVGTGAGGAEVITVAGTDGNTYAVLFQGNVTAADVVDRVTLLP